MVLKLNHVDLKSGMFCVLWSWIGSKTTHFGLKLGKGFTKCVRRELFLFISETCLVCICKSCIQFIGFNMWTIKHKRLHGQGFYWLITAYRMKTNKMI